MLKSTVLYARCSTDEQETASQRMALDDYDRKEILDGQYLEDHHTGRSLDRPELNKIKEGIRKGEVRRVVVWKLSRLGRNIREVLGFLDFAIKKGCEVQSLTEKIDFGSAMGRAMVAIIAAFDELTSDIISENTKAGLRASKTPKHRLSGARIKGLMWFSKQTLVKKNMVFRELRAGVSIREIAKSTGLDRNIIRKMQRLGESLVMSKKECEKLAVMIEQGRCANPFLAIKTNASRSNPIGQVSEAS